MTTMMEECRVEASPEEQYHSWIGYEAQLNSLSERIQKGNYKDAARLSGTISLFPEIGVARMYRYAGMPTDNLGCAGDLAKLSELEDRAGIERMITEEFARAQEQVAELSPCISEGFLL